MWLIMDYSEVPGVYKTEFSKLDDGNYKNHKNGSIYNFSLKKDVTYETEDSYIRQRDRIIKLDQDRSRLEKEFEGKVHIPDFSYEYDDNKFFLRTESEWIKGFFVGYQYQHILYKYLVEREDEWTFGDYLIPNFMYEGYSNKIYAIDLQSYQPITKKRRKEKWNKQRMNRIISETGWSSQRERCRWCMKSMQEIVSQYSFFGDNPF